MKKIVLFLAPIILGLFVFFVFLFFLSQSKNGNGALQVTAVPISTVFINGKESGKTPFCLCEGKSLLPAGTYTIRLVPQAGANILPYEDTVTITKGTLTVIDRTFGSGEFSSGSVISLSVLPNAATTQLFVTSFPSGAAVTLDGNSAGQTPLLIKSITSSDHDILLAKTGYASKTVHIHTVNGYLLKAVVTLGISQENATDSANLENASLTTTEKAKVLILDTPTGFLRVRAEPSLTASETAQVKPGDAFDYIDEHDGWYEINLSEGSTGWISTQYAQKK